METINDRMQMIADVMFDGNKAAFAKAIGIAPTSITNYLGKQRASRPSSDLLQKIVNSLDVDAMWLLTGQGELRRSAAINNKIDDSLLAKGQDKPKVRVVLELELSVEEFIKFGLKDKVVQFVNMK